MASASEKASSVALSSCFSVAGMSDSALVWNLLYAGSMRARISLLSSAGIAAMFSLLKS